MPTGEIRGFGGTGGTKPVTPSISETKPARLVTEVGVAPDLQATEMVEPVMPAAQRDKVGAVGGATVFPMGDVVNVQAVTKTTSRNHTASVTVLDEATDPAGHDPLIPTQVDRGAIAF